MQSLWNDQEAAQFQGDLAQRVYTSRLLGRDQALVMHGGGNTSVKIVEKNIFGDDEARLYVKGSGWDLATIEAPGFSPVRMEPLLRLAQLPRLSDTQMANELKAALTNASAPSPSVEAILHAILPFRFVDHSHADSIIAITNSVNGRERIEEIYGGSVVIIPYIMPGFKLARLCAEMLPKQATDQSVGMVLLKHGLFTFGDDAKTSYERHIELVTRAEDYLKSQNAWKITFPQPTLPRKPSRQEVADFRRKISEAAGFPVIIMTHRDAQSMEFLRRNDAAHITQQGPATPDHVLRTKRLPMLGRDIEAYTAAYEQYFNENAPRSESDLTMLDPAPRLVLDREIGLCAIGRNVKAARIAEDIYRHTITIILQANTLGGYEALPAADIFDVEYWDLEQAKLRKAGQPPVFTGEVALVTGAASGIGKACAESLLARGAAVVGLDINPAIAKTFDRPDFLGLRCDLTEAAALDFALERSVSRFGGLDMLILNAGIFPSSKRIADLDSGLWEKVNRINLDANLVLMRECYPLLKLAPNGGRVAVVGSKNVAAPGPGAAAYSATKAALNQLARVAALEWGQDNIRINTVHPNAVFDTGLWTESLLETRAQNYGLTVEEYKRNNVLGVEVTSRDVGELVAELCGPLFGKTTGAQIPIDGGNERVI
jgi:rhamnose utilization protein RhaD (predicted bifunctional aldolase and dehydrogenase)/NAD(P)-dependent dehydrogenase (short-subunit alcohol dehydrogenase family)